MLRRILAVAALLLPMSTLLAPPAAAAYPPRWQPGPNVTWQMQFSGRIDLRVSAKVFDLDAFETTPRQVATLHNKGRRAVCYVNAGAWEDWRPDADAFPSSVLGKPLDGWPGERWLDIRRIDILGPLMEARLDMCERKGFDGVEFDNVNGRTNDSGFPLTDDDQVDYNLWLADAAHVRGLAVGLKNTLDLVDALEPHFDFAILEQCFQYRECGQAAAFRESGKPVLDIEYALTRPEFCDRAARLGIFAMRKRLNLDAWRRPC